MKIVIDIPKEFEKDYNVYRFKDFFGRVLADIDYNGMCGNYEKETAEMFIKAFEESKDLQEQNKLLDSDIEIGHFEMVDYKELYLAQVKKNKELQEQNKCHLCSDELPTDY